MEIAAGRRCVIEVCTPVQLAAETRSANLSPPRAIRNQRGDAMKKLIALSAAAICAGLMLSAAPASAQQSRMKACNDEWNKMKEDKTVGDKKYADFRKECLAREAPADAGSKAAATTKSGGAVFPGSVSSKYSTESAGKARMHTCLDQYNANKSGTGNAGLHWIQKGGGYYSQCNAKLKS
jgi:hypothetical protein